MKKLACLTLTAIIALSGVSAVLAAPDAIAIQPPGTVNSPPPGVEVEDIVDRTPAFISVEGEITKIENDTIRVKDQDGGETDFIVGENTALLDKDGIVKGFEVGDTVTGYYPYNPKAPALMIYPPRRTASAIVKYGEDNVGNIFVNYFDDYGRSKNQLLSVKKNDATEIITPDGKPYEGEAFGHNLAVYATITTYSIPPQVTATKIVVLDADTESESVTITVHPTPITPVAPANSLDEISGKITEILSQNGKTVIRVESENGAVNDFTLTDETALNGTNAVGDNVTAYFVKPEIMTMIYPPQYTAKAIVSGDAKAYNINGVTAIAKSYTNKDGVFMVQLRPIAEAIGYTVKWDDTIKAVMLNNVTSLTIGRNTYGIGRMASRELSAAPELVNDTTYVPAEFFGEILNNNIIFR
ncbi:hypothetical protein FACS189490_01700 [Clostridia bacterium]|nr:hypothetical protein FACS189490_01700 [Clostridia bacterium]